MISEDSKILEINQYQRSDNLPFIIYADLECMIERINGRNNPEYSSNNPENSSTTKVSEHNPSGFSMSTKSSFRSIENNHGVYRGKDEMWIFKRARNENN